MKLAEFFEIVKAKIAWGWIQGRSRSYDFHGMTACCLSGALAIAHEEGGRDDNLVRSAVRTIREVIRLESSDSLGIADLVTWNDDPQRTKHEVLQVLNQCRNRCLENNL